MIKGPHRSSQEKEKMCVHYLTKFMTFLTGFFFTFVADGSGTIVVRGCALDSGTLTTDTEIIRMSHCGSFYFNDK